MRRDQRVALAAFRHHADPCKYSGKHGSRLPIRYTDHKGVDVLGEYDEVLATVDVIMVLVSELPESDVGDSIICDLTKKRYRLGREVQNDGYLRSIEILAK